MTKLTEPESWKPSLLDVGSLTIHPRNVRKTNPTKEVENMMLSIQELWGFGALGTGIIHPIIVDQENRVVLGQRRVTAMKRLLEETKDEKFRKIAGNIVTLTDKEAQILSMVDTCQTVPTETDDTVVAIDALYKDFKAELPGAGEGELYKKIGQVSGMSEHRIATLLSLRKWPKIIQDLFDSDMLSLDECTTLKTVWNRSKELREYCEEKEKKIAQDYLIKLAKGVRKHTLEDMRGRIQELKMKDLNEMLREPEIPEKVKQAVIEVKTAEAAKRPREPVTTPRDKTRDDKKKKKSEEPVQVKLTKRQEEGLKETEECHFQIPRGMKIAAEVLIEKKFGMSLPAYMRALVLRFVETGRPPEVE